MLVNAIPDSVDALLVVKTLKDTITADHEKVEVILQFETANLWVTDDNVRITSILLSLSLDVTESARHRETAREHAQRALHIKIFLIWGGCSLGKCLSSVDFSSGGLDSNSLLLIVRLVVSGENSDLRARVNGH